MKRPIEVPLGGHVHGDIAITQIMITADQLKDIQERAKALHRYLDIDRKRVELEEEELRTQAPDF